MLLLDTHTLFWHLKGIELSGAVRQSLSDAQRAGEFCISAISAWEMGILYERGRLSLTSTPDQVFRRLLRQPGVVGVDVSFSIALDAGQLPEYDHGDPADRILMATARELGATLVTRDRRIVTYAGKGHVRVLPC
jgi:PIN domain nuclease of toxin-antitoxin system